MVDASRRICRRYQNKEGGAPWQAQTSQTLTHNFSVASMSLSHCSLRVLAILFWALSPLAARAAHPLITEDTGTQGGGHFQLELTTEHATAKQDGHRQYIVLDTAVLTYGLTDSADVLVNVPYLRLGAAGGTTGEQGLADVGLDIKWRFYENGPLSMALKPGVTFPTGDDLLGLGLGKTSWSTYLVTGYDLASWAFNLHLGYLQHNNTLNERVDIWHASASVTRRMGASIKLVLDGGIDTNTQRDTDTEPLFATAGLIWSLAPNFDFDTGVRVIRTEKLDIRTWLAGLSWRW
jgi:hypothetical protein